MGIETDPTEPERHRVMRMALAIVMAVSAAAGCKSTVDDDYRAKIAEAKRMLKKIENRARSVFMEKNEFPRGSAPLTPARPCCNGPNHKCPPSPANWSSPIWQSLAFQLDEPHLFQYSYESDGRVVVARAVSDLDCSGMQTSIKLAGRVENGKPVFSYADP